jgi:hypothetical protein
MSNSSFDWTSCLLAARTLREIVAQPGGGLSPGEARHWVQRWMATVTGGDETRRLRWLELEEWNEDLLERALQAPVPLDLDFPPWAEPWCEALEIPLEDDAGGDPAERLFEPLVVVASATLGLPPDEGVFRSAFTRILMARLVELVARLAPREPGLLAMPSGSMRTRWREMLLTRYPVLTRLSGQRTIDWLEAFREFMDRFETDESRFADWLGEDPGDLLEIRPCGSLVTGGGRSALELEFSRGLTLIYRPRSLAIDDALDRWLRRAETEGFPVPIRVPTVLDRGVYGWSVAVPSSPPAVHPHERTRRAGALLALFTMLEGASASADLIGWQGDEPVLLEADTLFAPRWRPEFFEIPPPPHGPLTTGLLPGWSVTLDRHQLDLAGFGSPANGRDFRDLTARARWFAGTPVALSDRPCDAGRFDPGLDWDSGALERAFEETLEYLVNWGSLDSTWGGLRLAFEGLTVRLTLRPSRIYVSQLWSALEPESLADGRVWALHHEHLARSILSMPGRRALWPLLLGEVSALERFEIPRFWADVSATDAGLPVRTPLSERLIRSPLDTVHDRWSGLERTTILRWVRTIREAIARARVRV